MDRAPRFRRAGARPSLSFIGRKPRVSVSSAPSPPRSRIVRPGMLRVSTPQFLAHLGVGSLPEAAQVPCRLHGPPVRREQQEQHRLLPGADARCLRQAEQLLQLGGRRHHAVGVVFERVGPAARDGAPLPPRAAGARGAGEGGSSVLAMTSPVSTACPPSGPVAIMAGCPTVTARSIRNRFAIAAMNECMSSKNLFSCFPVDRGWP